MDEIFFKATKKIMLTLAIMLIVGSSAYASDFGIGVGVGFPVGERAGYSKSENYAAFTLDKVIEELTVTERHGRLRIEFKITNDGDTEYTVEHNDGQCYDMAILDKNGNALWKASDGMAFTQALNTVAYPPHQSVVYTAEIERKDYRKLKEDGVIITAFLTDTPYRLSTRLPDVTKSDRSAIGGTIIIGGGSW